MRCHHLTLLVVAIAFAMNGYAADSWNAIHCSPVDTAEASGIHILNEHGTELFRVCQDGSLLPQTGFTNVTSEQSSDFLFVTQVGAKLCEATLYRKSGAHYIRVGWWGGWDIRVEKWHNRPAIHYEEFEPTVEHAKSVVYFTWNGNRIVPDRSAPMGAKWPEHLPELDLALHTGMRRSEQYSLTWTDVDFLNRVVTVRRTKNGEVRHIKVNQVALSAFQALFARSSGGEGYVFTNSRGEHLLNSRHWFERAVAKAEIQDFTWQCLRHTFASRLVMVESISARAAANGSQDDSDDLSLCPSRTRTPDGSRRKTMRDWGYTGRTN